MLEGKRPDIRGKAIKALVDEIKKKPCMDCAGQYPSEAMDFDHRPGTSKIMSVAQMVGGRYSWELIEAEIAKCDLVCSNCHRTRSRKRLNEDPDGRPEFKPFPKIARWSREVVVTEKIDGSNGVVVITGSGDVLPGSKSRWLRPKLSNMGSDPDNFGFAQWVRDHEEELYEGLGEGVHGGEWMGQGIQRKYGLDHRRFYLFNTHRWSNPETRPACCHVVPVLYQGNVDDMDICQIMNSLEVRGSVAIPGFMKPEGVVIFHTKSGTLYKKTLVDDDQPKSISGS